MAGIYIHIPFCKKACNYCNFHFTTNQAGLPIMLDAMIKEMEIKHSNWHQESFETIYFGGGTPSLLSETQLNYLLAKVFQIFSIRDNPEITLEANPDDINGQTLAAWKKAGINRLSIGVQSFFDRDLAWMNRPHSSKQSMSAVVAAQHAGFSNISIDLMYALPELSDEEWIQNLEKAFNLNVQHLSCYNLTVEEKTKLRHSISRGIDTEPDDEQGSRQFEILMETSSKAGFEHYEISNFSIPGYRSRHNSGYWDLEKYLGIGPSAHSFDGKTRMFNPSSNALYVKTINSGSDCSVKEESSIKSSINDYILIRLRTIEGISLPDFERRFGQKELFNLMQNSTKSLQKGLLQNPTATLKLSKAGKLLADEVAMQLFK